MGRDRIAAADGRTQNGSHVTLPRLFSARAERRPLRTDELPNLGFGNGVFDLALCSHFLFTYSEQLSIDFHVAAIGEMFCVAGEARIFPLLNTTVSRPDS